MAMDPVKKAKLEAAGWKAGSADEFLGLNPEESALLDIRMSLSTALRQRRQEAHLAQLHLAEKIKSSQSRVAKMEACDSSVSIDLLIKAILATGATPAEIGQYIANAAPDRQKAA